MSKGICLHQSLKSFRFSQFRFTISPLERLHLPPFKGSTLRGAFGTAFKRMVCLLRQEDCTNCALKQKCAYSHIFESPRSSSRDIERKTSHDPHPFVIEPPLEARQEYLPGENLSFDLVLVGKGADYFPYFILAFEELGRMGIGWGRGSFQLVRVEHITRPEEERGELIYESDTKTVRANYQMIDFNSVLAQTQGLKPNCVTLDFLTPTRIKRQSGFTFISPLRGECQQELVARLDFVTFVRSLLRRLSWLSEAYCGEKWDLDYASLLALANEVRATSSCLYWYDWERYSNRQHGKLKMGGFVGRITFEGELSEFLPFIKLGEYLHVGQGTAFGLGKYIVEST